MTVPARPLADALDRELLRAYLRSGELIGTTFYGPVRFNRYGQSTYSMTDLPTHFYGPVRFNRFGQNVGKEPTSLQVRGGVAKVVLPLSLQELGYAFVFPAPAVECRGSHSAST